MSVKSVIGGSWATWSSIRGNDDDDYVDRLNHLYTVTILVVFALFVGGGQYVGDPIECWCPAEFTKPFIAYTKSYCWVKNTYFLPMHESIPTSIEEREDSEIVYYQWIPIILVFMAFMFKIPYIMWKMLNSFSGINLNKIVVLTANTQVGDAKKRDGMVVNIANYLDKWLYTHRQYRNNIAVRVRKNVSAVGCFLFNHREGTFLTGIYLLCKVFYLANVIGQFFILNGFLGGFYSLYGVEVLDNVVSNKVWRESLRFPRVTLCDFRIRQLQNIQRYTVQCVLPINLFNEKIFIFLWFWFLVVAIITASNFLLWLWRSLFRENRVKFVKKYLRIVEAINGSSDKKICRRFSDEYLRDDGIFLLRIVAKNSNEVLLTDLIHYLWKMYNKRLNAEAETDGGDNDDLV
ncbi:hypothetical protein ScPMuIL_017223 [Solemya velum]